jgi:tRNA (guanine-N7-)-methyltransferase
VAKCTAHPYFERLPDEEVQQNDPAVRAMCEETEESKKVARIGGRKYFAVFRRRDVSELPPPVVFNLWDS